MFEILAQVGETAVKVGAGGVAGIALYIIGQVVRKGFHAKIDLGEANGNGHNKGPCPLHQPLVDLLNEREQNRVRDHAETVQEVRDLKGVMLTGFDRVHERINQMGK